MASQLISIKLVREDSSIPWGFRLEGGIDVGHCLNIQKVTPGGLAERKGVRDGDLVVKINSSDTQTMRHEDAKMEIIRSCNDFILLLKRDGSANNSIVQPTIINLVKSAPVTNSAVYNPTVYRETQKSPLQTNLKTTLNTNFDKVGVSHNVNPVPFGYSPPAPGQTLVAQTVDGRVHSVAHSSYNSPMSLYSQKHVNTSFGKTVKAAGNDLSQAQPVAKSGTKLAMNCGACGGLIRGVFVKVQNRIPMHPECLKCSKCNVGLRNVGYFYINDVLYCETHARRAAPPPVEGMKPVVVYK